MVPFFGILEPGPRQRFRSPEAPQKVSFFGGVSALTPEAILTSEAQPERDRTSSESHLDKLENPESLLTQ